MVTDREARLRTSDPWFGSATAGFRADVAERRQQMLETVKRGSKPDNDVAALEAEVQSLIRDRTRADASIERLETELAECDERRATTTMLHVTGRTTPSGLKTADCQICPRNS